MEEQAQQQNTGAKRPALFHRLLLTLIALAMILAAVAAVVFRDVLNLDSLKRWFHYRSLVLSDSGQAESFSYDGALSDTFAVLDGDLLVCSANAISLYSGSGTRYVHESVSMSNPVVNTNGSLAVVYDAGGSSLCVLGQRQLIWSSADLSALLDRTVTGGECEILSARLNRSGLLTVVTQSRSYRGVVSVLDGNYQPVMSVSLSSAFVMDAALSDDGKTLAIVTVGQNGGSFATALEFSTLTYSAGDYTPDRVCSLGSNVVLEVKHTADALWAVGDRGLTVTGHDGATSSADWSDLYLKRYTLSGDGFAVALLGRYRAGSQAELWVVSGDGTRHSMAVNEQVLSVSAAGRYLSVLTGSRLDIYTQDLELYSSLDSTKGARSALLLSDGSAILISPEGASFYVP